MNESIISIVTNNFRHDSRVLKEAVSLKDEGFNITVIALHEKELAENEIIEGIPVHRIRLKSKNWPKIPFIQLLKLIEFIYRITIQYRQADIVHCNDLGTLPIGVLIKIFSKTKIVYDSHEYQIDKLPDQSKIDKRIAYITERIFIRYADVVINVSNSIAEEYSKLYNIDRPIVVLNAPKFVKIEKKNHFRKKFKISEDKFIFLYQGVLNKSRNLDILLEAFKDTDEPFVIVFMGFGPLKDLIIEYSQKYENIYFHDAVPLGKIIEYTSSANFGIIFYKNNCLNHNYCSPNKLYEYTMAEIPIIASNLFEMKKIVEEYGIGIVADRNTVEGLIEATIKISKIEKDIFHDKILRFKSLFNWETQEKLLIRAYKDISK